VGKVEKVVVDTNIFISAFGWGGQPLKIIELLEKGKLRNCTSEDIIRELFSAISYSKLGFPQIIQTEILEFVLAYSDIYDPKERIGISPDPEDNKFIECALSAKAKFIITGDKGLLSIKQFRGVKIITPEDFLKSNEFHR